jgi:hypothetical protein
VSRLAGGLTKLERLIPALERLAGVPLRVWRVDGQTVRLLGGSAVPWTPPLKADAAGAGRRLTTPGGPAWFEPVRGGADLWLEITDGDQVGAVGAQLTEVVGCLVEAERQAAQVAAELSDRYEEIDLVYTISEILDTRSGSTRQRAAFCRRSPRSWRAPCQPVRDR